MPFDFEEEGNGGGDEFHGKSFIDGLKDGLMGAKLYRVVKDEIGEGCPDCSLAGHAVGELIVVLHSEVLNGRNLDEEIAKMAECVKRYYLAIEEKDPRH